MTTEGEWATPELAVIGQQLLPDNLSLNYINDFVDEIRRINERNPFLMDFASALEKRSGRELISRISTNVAWAIPEIVAFAMVLENLLVAIHNSADFLEKLMDHWDQEGSRIDLNRQQEMGFRLKFASVRAPIRKALKLIRRGEVPGNFCNFHLPFNIHQAVAFDFFSGNRSNAAAGLILARCAPGNKPEPATGAGPVRLSDCGQMTETGFPLSEMWVDLYQSWNLAFGAQFASFPLYICKLVIPQVAGYQGRSQQYVWDRTNALMIYLYFASFANYDRNRGKAEKSAYYDSDWSAFSDSGLLELWGQINQSNASDYREKIQSARIKKAAKN